jgi:hypothetical protein
MNIIDFDTFERVNRKNEGTVSDCDKARES